MADLDDFFAKKDRKRSKGTKKFTTTDEIAKKLEETGKRTEKPKKDKAPNETEEVQQTEEEDEWKVFEEEKKDYSGLKIGNLTLNETLGTESDNERGTGENSSDGESGEGGGKHSGPWKKNPDQPEQAVVEPVEVAAPPPPPPSASQTGPSSYKPPHLRNMPAISPSLRTKAKNIAPDIHSEQYFPTLSGNKQPQATDGRRRRDEGTFEEVRNRGGSRGYSMQEAHPQPTKLSLGNKYGALSQDQS